MVCWQIVALSEEEQVFKFGSLGFNLHRILLMCQPSFCKFCVNSSSPLAWLQQLPFPPVQNQDGLCPWTAAAWPKPPSLSFSLLSFHPNCCSLKSQTNCVLRLRLTRLGPTEHLNKRAKYLSLLAELQKSHPGSCALCWREKESPRLWLQFWDKCSQTSNSTYDASGF